MLWPLPIVTEQWSQQGLLNAGWIFTTSPSQAVSNSILCLPLLFVSINSLLIIPYVRHCQTLKHCSAHVENSTLTYSQPGIHILSILLFSKDYIICLNCYVPIKYSPPTTMYSPSMFITSLSISNPSPLFDFFHLEG